MFDVEQNVAQCSRYSALNRMGPGVASSRCAQLSLRNICMQQDVELLSHARTQTLNFEKSLSPNGHLGVEWQQRRQQNLP